MKQYRLEIQDSLTITYHKVQTVISMEEYDLMKHAAYLFLKLSDGLRYIIQDSHASTFTVPFIL